MKKKLDQRSVYIVVSTTFVSLLGMPIIGPVLPMLQQEFDISNRDIGWMLMSSYTLPALIFIPLTGFLADRYGKKNVLVPSLFIFGLSGTLISLAPNSDTIITLRFFQGLGGSGLVTLCTAMVPDLFHGKERVRVIGYTGITQSLGSGILPLIGGMLATISWFLPFTTAFIAIPVGIYLLIFLDTSKPSQSSGGKTYIQYAWRHLADRRVIVLCFFSFGYIFVGFGAFVSYIPSFMNVSFQSGPMLIGLIVAARAITGAIASSLLNNLVSLLSTRTLILLSFLILALGMSCIPLFENIWSVIIAALCYGAGFGITRPLIQVLLFDIAPPDLRATFSSANGTALRIAQTTSPFVAGLIIASYGFHMLYLLAALFSCFMMLIALTSKSLNFVVKT